MIARAAAAQDEITGDGTTTNVLLIAELMKQAERFLSEGLHPRVVTDGFEQAKKEAVKVRRAARLAVGAGSGGADLLTGTSAGRKDAGGCGEKKKVLDTFKRPVTVDRSLLLQVARTALRTKVRVCWGGSPTTLLSPPAPTPALTSDPQPVSTTVVRARGACCSCRTSQPTPSPRPWWMQS